MLNTGGWARAGVSIVLGLLMGLLVASLIGIPRLIGAASVEAFLANAFTFWGVLFGTFAALIGTGLVFALLARREPRRSKWGRRIAGLTLGLLALTTILWILMWRFSLWTLEGLWIYSLAIVATAGSVALLWPRGRDVWVEPPSPR
jgi:hypothetical protein